MMITAIHGDARSTATSAISTPVTSSLSAVVSRNEPSLVVTLPAAREVAVDPVGRGRDEEQDRRPGRRRAGIGAVDHQQRHHDRREDDPQRRAGRQEASRPHAATRLIERDVHEAAGCYRAPSAGRDQVDALRVVAVERSARDRRASSSASARSAALTSGIRLGAMLSSRTPRPASSTAAAGSPASSPQTPTQRPCSPAAAVTRRDQAQHRRLRAGEQRRRAPRCRARRPSCTGRGRWCRPRRSRPRGAKRVGRQRDGRHLDHDADLDRRRAELGARLLERARAARTRPASPTIGNITAHRMLGGDGEDRAQLGAQQLGLLRARAGCPRTPRNGLSSGAWRRKRSGLSAPASSVRTISGRPSSAAAISA